MTWRCSGCGETHDDAFRSCWRCGASRAATAAEDAEEEEDARAAAAEDAAVEDALERQAAVEAYEAKAGWLESPTADRATVAGQFLHRLTVAYRHYRERQEAGPGRARPDLDRLWTQFFVSCAVLGGALLSSFTPVSVLDLLARFEPMLPGFFVGGMLVCVVTGRRAVDRELRAAAENAVDHGEHAS